MILVGRGEKGERDDREGEVRQLVPDPGDGDGETDGRRGKSQDRSIEYEPAIPTAAPAGDMVASAVDAWVIARACRNPSPGRAAIQGGGKVARLSNVAATNRRPVLRTEPANDVQDLAVVRDTREEEHEDGDDHRDRPRGPEESPVGLRQAPPRRARAVRHSQEPIVRQIPHSKGEP